MDNAVSASKNNAIAKAVIVVEIIAVVASLKFGVVPIHITAQHTITATRQTAAS
jgi:hypothetical protein